jgi:hypothetical protein
MKHNPKLYDYNELSNEEKQLIENNKYLHGEKIDYKFIFNNFGKCYTFLGEMVQTEGIVPEEHLILNEIRKKKIKYEQKASNWITIIYFLLHARHFIKAKNYLYKAILFGIYPLFMFDASYNFGKIFGGFLILPSSFNKLITLRGGNSIQAIQTKLFIKRCLFEEYLTQSGKIPKETWVNHSYVVNKVFGKAFAKVDNLRRDLEARGILKFNQKS